MMAGQSLIEMVIWSSTSAPFPTTPPLATPAGHSTTMPMPAHDLLPSTKAPSWKTAQILEAQFVTKST